MSQIEDNKNLTENQERMRKMDCLIIDEISMLSQRSFEQVHHMLQCVRKNRECFGGIQLIVSGDFYQLSPVPCHNYGDPGYYAFLSPVWRDIFKHHIRLDNVHRQEQSDLVKAVRQLSKGDVDEDVCHLLKRLVAICIHGHCRTNPHYVLVYVPLQY